MAIKTQHNNPSLHVESLLNDEEEGIKPEIDD